MGETFYERRKKTLPPRVSRDVIDRKNQKEHASIYNDKRWKKLRAKKMKMMPICPDPFGHHSHKVVESKEVHHIVPLSVDKSLAYDESNLIPLCRSCHAQADAMDRVDPARQREIMQGVLSITGKPFV